MPKLTRIAPTPSGYLHLGNCANFLLVERLAKQLGAEILLRIDDCDGSRARREFIDHIFETLAWLGISWQRGPRDSDDFSRNFSQNLRKAYYFERLQALSADLYACVCSRREIDGIYAGTCRHRGLPFSEGTTAMRLRMKDSLLAAKFGDPVLWRKDGGPAYQWVSVVDDLDASVDLVVRGEDLRTSTALQTYIAGRVRPGGFGATKFLHHPLIMGADGTKLAKSLGASSVVELRREGISAADLRTRLDPLVEDWARTAH